MGAFTLQREGDVGVVVFDLPGESVNKFSRNFSQGPERSQSTRSISCGVLTST